MGAVPLTFPFSVIPYEKKTSRSSNENKEILRFGRIEDRKCPYETWEFLNSGGANLRKATYENEEILVFSGYRIEINILITQKERCS